MKAPYLAIPFLLLSGCAHAHRLSDPPDARAERHFNSVAHLASVTLEKADGGTSIIVSPLMSNDGVQWHDSLAQQTANVPYAEISTLSFRSKKRGLSDGVLIGGGLGLALGFVAIAGTAGMCQGTTCSLSSRMPLLVLALPPALLGAIIGSSAGARERFTLPRDSE